MKQPFKLLTLLTFSLSVMSCSNSGNVIDEQTEDVKRPFVDFEMQPTNDPFTFNVISKAQNYKTLEWRFGDDSLGTDTTKTHMYAVPGTYEVTLTAIAESGATAKKLIAVKIHPDSVVKVSAMKTATPNEVMFSIDSKAEIGSVEWTLDAQTKPTTLNPVKTYKQGTLNAFSLKLVTRKGAVVNVDKFVTTEGVVSNVTNQVSLSVSADNSGGKNANEGSLKLIDADTETKMYTPWPGTYWAQFTFPGPTSIKFYGIGSANDAPTRDPKDWTLQGSNDGLTWEILDTRTGNTFNGVYKTMFYFAVQNPKPFLYYRWNVTANNGSSGFQFSEFRLFK